MEAQYHQFGPVSVTHEHTATTSLKGTKNMVVYILYGVPVVLLFILLLLTGVKFSQLSNAVNDIKKQLMTKEAPAHYEAQSEELMPEQVYLDSIVPVRGQCGEGWVSFEKSCYLLSTTTESWSRAEAQCQRHQGHLLVLNNVEELDYISKIVNIYNNYWIGLVERQQEGHWSWVDGTDYNSTQTFWDRGQPDNWDYRENGEDCGQIHASAKHKRKLWNDADCSLPYRYICEINI